MNRTQLQAGACIVLGNDSGIKASFKIHETIGEGGSAICYGATSPDANASGVLKEYYPHSCANIIQRNVDGQLMFCDEIDSEIFSKVKKEILDYRNVYNEINALCRDDGKEELGVFIPHFEIYSGINSLDGTTIPYIWIPYPKKISFDKICEEKYQHPDTEPGKKLWTLINDICQLLDCVTILHKKEFVHGDIKPENFGFYARKDKELAGTITFFDVNSVSSVYDECQYCFFSNGYSAPELRWQPPDGITDIYSIGATLLYALKIDIAEYKKSKDKADLLYDLVSGSALINHLDDRVLYGKEQFIRNIVTVIKQTVCVRDLRYKCCEDVSFDLENALHYLEQYKTIEDDSNIFLTGRKNYRDKQTAIAETVDLGAVGAIQYHLYRQPLYKFCKKTEYNNRLDILVVGAGVYGTAFVDNALQLMQVEGYEIDITFVSSNMARDKTLFLTRGTGNLEESDYFNFFNIDERKAKFTSYGNLHFVDLWIYGAFRKVDSEHNRRLLKEIARTVGKQFSYVFVALNNDELNLKIAKNCSEVFKNASVCFAFFGDYGKNIHDVAYEFNDDDRITPINVRKTIKDDEEYDFLRHMAFNVHLTWSGGIGYTPDEKNKYESENYNRNSSFANAISIKYKLHSIGIKKELSKDTVDEIVEEYCLLVSCRQDLIHKLAMYEHRRWVIEKLADGWHCLNDLGSLKHDTKDKEKRLHPCIVDSCEESPLSSEEWSMNNYEKWRICDDCEIAKLDAIDQMSVRLYRHFAEMCKPDNVLAVETPLSDLESAFGEIVGNVFEEYSVSVRKFFSNNGNVALYRYFKNVLKRHLSTLDDDVKKQIEDKLEKIDEVVFPYIQVQEPTIWKEKDIDILRNTPFILTYSTSIHLFVPLETSAKKSVVEKVLQNTAATLTLNPAILTFVISGSDLESSTVNVRADLLNAIRFLSGRSLQTEIDVCILNCESHHRIDNLGEFSTTFYEVTSTELTSNILQNILNRKTRNAIVAAETNETAVGKRIAKEQGLPLFSFDLKNLTFSVTDGLKCFSYIPFTAQIFIDEILAMVRDMSCIEELGSSDIYSFFFDRYDEMNHKGAWSWRDLTSLFFEHFKGDVEVHIDKQDTNICEYYEAFFPSFKWSKIYSNVLSQLLKSLESKNLVKELKWQPVFKTSQVKIFCKCTKSVKCGLQSLKNLLLEHQDKRIKFRDYRSNITIIFENLEMILPKVERNEFDNILEQLQEEGYIYISDFGFENKIEMCSSPVRDLLINPSRIFEAYIYYQAISSGFFDDVRLVRQGEIVYICATKDFSLYMMTCLANEKKMEEVLKSSNSFCKDYSPLISRIIFIDDYVGQQTTPSSLELSLTQKNVAVIPLSEYMEESSIGDTNNNLFVHIKKNAPSLFGLEHSDTI